MRAFRVSLSIALLLALSGCPSAPSATDAAADDVADSAADTSPDTVAQETGADAHDARDAAVDAGAMEAGDVESGTDAAASDASDASDADTALDVAAPDDASDAAGNLDANDVVDVLDADDAASALDAADANDAADALDANDASDASDALDVSCGDAAPCGAMCTDLATDPSNCGACGHDCNALPGVVPGLTHCTAGTCDTTGACSSGFAHCTSNPDNGCETDITTNAHCGSCGTACVAPTPVCTPSSSGYTCTTGCPSGQANCRGVCSDTTSDPRNCGGCGIVCPTITNGTPTCSGSVCGIQCNSGYDSCGGRCVRRDPTACGPSCTVCPVPTNGTASCSSTGTCSVVCTSGYHACGTNCALNGDINACGSSCTVCPTSPNGTASCPFGSCQLTCNSGYRACNGTCVSTTDVTACGTSCAVCPTPTNGTAFCSPTSGCGVTCDPGYHACGSQCLSNTSVNSCGTACLPCTAPTNGSVTCNGTSCQTSCDPGFHACGSQCLSDTSPNSCGARCYACPAGTGEIGTCTNGTCGTTCAPGYHACLYAGCRSNTSVDSCGSSCQSCGTPPAHGTTTCDGTSCGFACVQGYTLTGGNCVPVVAPRPIAPLSSAVVTSRRPTLRWALPTGSDGARVEVCRDRACTVVVTTFDATGTSGAPATDLPNRILFWHARGLSGGAPYTAFGPTWEFTVGTRSALVNAAWGSVPDVNGDGYADIIVGASATPNALGQSYAGAAFVYNGASGTIPSTFTTQLGTGRQGEFFGQTVASVGDLDGDGFPELATVSGTSSSGGAVYVHFGNPQGLFNGGATRQTLTIGAASVAGAGDVNGDGYGDLVVGAPGSLSAGTVYVYYGSASGLPINPSVTIMGFDGTQGAFGTAVAGVDVNGDGYGDVIATAPTAGSGPGRVHLFLGGTSGITTVPSLSLNSPDGNGSFYGGSAANGGDVNGDGYADVLVGAYGVNSRAGRVYLYAGSASGLATTPAAVLDGRDGADAYFGYAIASAGDLNGDGYGDAVVGAWNAGSPGAAYVYYGSAIGLQSVPNVSMTGGFSGSDFGWSVAGAGDVNGDGYSELLVGDQHADQVWVFSGGASGVSQGSGNTVILQPPSTGGNFGSSVASRGVEPGAEELQCSMPSNPTLSEDTVSHGSPARGAARPASPARTHAGSPRRARVDPIDVTGAVEARTVDGA